MGVVRFTLGFLGGFVLLWSPIGFLLSMPILCCYARLIEAEVRDQVRRALRRQGD